MKRVIRRGGTLNSCGVILISRRHTQHLSRMPNQTPIKTANQTRIETVTPTLTETPLNTWMRKRFHCNTMATGAWGRVRSTCRCTGSRKGQCARTGIFRAGSPTPPERPNAPECATTSQCAASNPTQNVSHSKKRSQMKQTGQTRSRACVQKCGEYS